MSDIFLSYAIEDRDKAARLAEAFEQQHWTVWWDTRAIPSGADYDGMMAKEFNRAKVIIMLRSRAGSGALAIRGAYKPEGSFPIIVVQFEKTELPEPIVETFDLSNWNGAATHPGLQALLSHLHTLIATSSPPSDLSSPERPKSSLLSSKRVNIRNLLPASNISAEERNARFLWEERKKDLISSSTIMTANKAPAEEPAKIAPQRTESCPKEDARFKGIFISYRRNEAAAYAGRLYDRLAGRFGRERVFIDTENVGWGEDFVEVITAAAESCGVMITLISPRWSRGTGGQEEVDDYVRLEVAKALGRKIRVIPILIQGAAMPAPKELPEDLAPLVRRNALALSDTRWERDVEDLIKSLENLL